MQNKTQRNRTSPYNKQFLTLMRDCLSEFNIKFIRIYTNTYVKTRTYKFYSVDNISPQILEKISNKIITNSCKVEVKSVEFKRCFGGYNFSLNLFVRVAI